MITVQQLIDLLKKENPASQVIIQKNPGGSPLYSLDGDAIYEPDTTWSGELFSTMWSAYDADMPQDEWNRYLEKPRCVVLAPTI